MAVPRTALCLALLCLWVGSAAAHSRTDGVVRLDGDKPEAPMRLEESHDIGEGGGGGGGKGRRGGGGAFETAVSMFVSSNRAGNSESMELDQRLGESPNPEEVDACGCELSKKGWSGSNGGKCRRGSTTNAHEAEQCLKKEVAGKPAGHLMFLPKKCSQMASAKGAKDLGTVKLKMGNWVEIGRGYRCGRDTSDKSIKRYPSTLYMMKQTPEGVYTFRRTWGRRGPSQAARKMKGLKFVNRFGKQLANGGGASYCFRSVEPQQKGDSFISNAVIGKCFNKCKTFLYTLMRSRFKCLARARQVLTNLAEGKQLKNEGKRCARPCSIDVASFRSQNSGRCSFCGSGLCCKPTLREGGCPGTKRHRPKGKVKGKVKGVDKHVCVAKTIDTQILSTSFFESVWRAAVAPMLDLNCCDPRTNGGLKFCDISQQEGHMKCKTYPEHKTTQRDLTCDGITKCDYDMTDGHPKNCHKLSPRAAKKAAQRKKRIEAKRQMTKVPRKSAKGKTSRKANKGKKTKKPKKANKGKKTKKPKKADKGKKTKKAKKKTTRQLKDSLRDKKMLQRSLPKDLNWLGPEWLPNADEDDQDCISILSELLNKGSLKFNFEKANKQFGLRLNQHRRRRTAKKNQRRRRRRR